MDRLDPIVIEFEGHDVRTFVWNGRAAWIAREIALAIGYGHLGRRLIDQISGDWADDFIPGFDYDLLEGHDAALFTESDRGADLDPTADHGVVVLYESGLHLVLSRTNDAARCLRLHLLTEVLSALPEPDLDVEPDRVRPFCTPHRAVDALIASEHALDRDLDDRMFRVATLHRTADLLRDLGRLDDDQRVLLEVSACEIALGFPLIHLYPPPVREAVAHALGVPVESDSEEPVATAA